MKLLLLVSDFVKKSDFIVWNKTKNDTLKNAAQWE